MKKMMTAVCLALLAGSTLSAQENGNAPRTWKNPEPTAKRVAAKLMLDENTTEKFVPLYQEYMQKLAECRTPRNDNAPQTELSDKEIDEEIKARFSAEEQRLDVQKTYYEKFKEILTMRQVRQLFERPNMGNARQRSQKAKYLPPVHRRIVDVPGAKTPQTE